MSTKSEDRSKCITNDGWGIGGTETNFTELGRTESMNSLYFI